MKTVYKRKNKKSRSRTERMMMWILVFTLGFVLAPHAGAQDKHNLIVQSDIGKDPDDHHSVVRVLLESNEYNLLGLIATDDDEYNVDQNFDMMVDAYEEVYPNLIKHDDGYPTADYLRSVVAMGNDRWDPNRFTDGAKLIIKQVDAATKPVWVASFGSTTTLARAIKEVQATRTTAQLNAFISKIRLYEAYGQCSNGQWLATNFPDMVILRDSPIGGNHAVNWTERLNNSKYNRNYVDDNWYLENIVDKGPLGDPTERKLGNDADLGIYRIRHPRWSSDQGGPLYLMSAVVGLSDVNQPTWGGWGGRFNSIKTRNPGPLANSFTAPAKDYYILTTGHDTYAGENTEFITTARWRKAVQNDLLARFNWSVATKYSDANHPPVAKVDGSLRRTVTSGAVVDLSAAGSTDPDGDPLMYKWWHYPEPSTYKKTLAISNAGSRDASFVAPDVASTQTIHTILEVTDTGTPPLTRYQRVIVTVNPGPNPPARNPAPVIYDSPWHWNTNPQVKPSGVSNYVANYARKSQTLHVVAGYEDRAANPGEFTYTWTKVSGPGTVSFDNTNGTANGNICNAVFPDPSSGCVKYELLVTVSNGTKSVTAPLTFVLTGTSPGNPGRPNPTATAVSSSRINLSWENVRNNYGYRIIRRIGTAGEWTDVADVAQNVTSYANTGLSAGTTYHYRVQTLGPRFVSYPSDIRSATTQGTKVEVYAPLDLNASASGLSQINLSWRDNSDNESGFRIERRTGTSGTWGEIATVGANVTGYANTGLSAGTTYYYRLRAYKSNANSAYSNEANNTTQGSPEQ